MGKLKFLSKEIFKAGENRAITGDKMSCITQNPLLVWKNALIPQTIHEHNASVLFLHHFALTFTHMLVYTPTDIDKPASNPAEEAHHHIS
ncbi:MAG: hypothetical protein AB7D19_11370 [Acetobacter sp.]|uniref:hypothetical protein n=1 Tax=Acetobacter sp. TaxID=440 RepID=UPI003D06E068